MTIKSNETSDPALGNFTANATLHLPIADKLPKSRFWLLTPFVRGRPRKSFENRHKLYSLNNSAIELLSERPDIGRPMDEQGVRLKVVRDCFTVYEKTGEQLNILSFWDTRTEARQTEENKKNKKPITVAIGNLLNWINLFKPLTL